MAEIQDKLKDLKGYIEEGFIVEYLGEYYTVYGEDCPHCKELGIEIEQGNIEITETLAIRRAIGWGTNEDNRPYTNTLETSKLQNIKEFNVPILGRFVTDNPESEVTTYLPDSEFIVNKVIKDFPKNYKNGEIEHILYDPDNENYICVKQVCSQCTYQQDCVLELQKLPNKMSIINGDYRSQEPRAFTIYRSGEPKWLEVFQNDSLRGYMKLLDYINLIFQQEVKINTETDKKYWEFLDYHFFDDKTGLYKLNHLVELCKTDSSSIPQLQEHIEYIVSLWSGFKTQEEQILERKHKESLVK